MSQSWPCTMSGFSAEYATQFPRRPRIDGGRRVRPRRVGVPRKKRDAVLSIRYTRTPETSLDLRQLALLERHDSHVVPARDQLAAQILDDSLLPSDGRRVELRHHQDAHAVSLKTYS